VETARGIVLRRARYGETSLIVSWLTDRAGRIRTVAKGALKPSGALAGKIDLFYEADLAFRRSGRSDLHALAEVGQITAREGLRHDLGRIGAAAYFVRLIERVTETDTPTPELWDLFRRALDYLNAQPATRLAVEHFERETARFTGLGGGAGADAGHAALAAAFGGPIAGRAELLARLPAR
jgi:DNA repair protein RecO (recombination protein O)